MRLAHPWKPVLVGFAITPICLYLAALSTGAGHGSYFWAKAFFPYTTLAEFTTPSLVLAVLQFPLYGVVLGLAEKRYGFVRPRVVLSVVHFTAVLAVFLFPPGSLR